MCIDKNTTIEYIFEIMTEFILSLEYTNIVKTSLNNYKIQI